MEQTPSPGQHILACCGDTIEFTLQLPRAEPGQAFLRTNIGHAATARQAIIREVLDRQPRLAEDWFDIPMVRLDERRFRLALPLIEPGHFEAKAFFLPAQAPHPQWPEGPNTTVNVHPAPYSGANSLYNAFVRQFGQKERSDHSLTPAQAPAEDGSAWAEKVVQMLDEDGYTVIPPSGTFRDLIRKLDFIINRLHCRILLLLPIHPTPTVYGRMGDFGSPYAALDFMDVDPALAEFDPKATPLEQFQELVDAIHARGARLFLDIAINHTGWAAKIHSLHPDWLVRDADGTIRSPGAWGVVWRDLTELNHAQDDLWRYLADVFLTWCRRGVDGFRCDAGYMIPVPAWEFIVATVRREFPDTLFLLEGLGGKIETTTALLNVANLNWAYSELFQNVDQRQIEIYLPLAVRASETDGLMMHFAETHDNNRLAARSHSYARMRTALSALCSSRGAFAFANGVEWLAAEKIDVHGRSSLNWDSPVNQVNYIVRLNSLLSAHPAFFGGAQLRLIHRGNGNSIALLRHHPSFNKTLLILVNLDDDKANSVAWSIQEAGVGPQSLMDLLSEKKVAISVSGDLAAVELAPGEVLCLTAESQDVDLVRSAENRNTVLSDQVRHQCLRACALEALAVYRGMSDLSDINPDCLAMDLAADPPEFCRRLNPESENVVAWEWPCDAKREVMIPPRHFLYITAPFPFRAQVSDDRQVLRQAEALQQADGQFFALFSPFPAPGEPRVCALRLSVYEPGRTAHVTGHLLMLPPGELIRIPVVLARNDLLDTRRLVLGTNGRGGMMRARVIWAELSSRYDALLAGNLNVEYPEDRRIMLSRCRAWLVYHGYSQDITVDRQQAFVHGENFGLWRFRVPFGHGLQVWFDIRSEMMEGKNAVRLTFFRRPADPGQQCLADEHPVVLIVRPDIEDRSFHEDTKAFLGPEKAWPAAIHPEACGFTFSSDPSRQLRMTASSGLFQIEPEWQYMVHHPVEAERGLNPTSDLFSPGYFRLSLAGGEEAVILAQILTPQERETLPVSTRRKIEVYPPPAAPQATRVPATEPRPLLEVLEQAMRQFIVKRGHFKTVIAGYPWFLDWGRDTLICTRGMIAAGMLEDVKAMLKQFAHFEQDSTLPNMIQGDHAGNRDTSDAPLWLIVACADWCRAAGHRDLLNEKCGGRAVRQALESIANGYKRGTPNGIMMDSESGLIFSPAHFTWMDTNFPAGTPREGYPIEIQALWFAALTFLAQTGNHSSWGALAERVRDSIIRYYWNPNLGYLSDCLHAPAGRPAAKAAPDDALRPNQLLALTLGAVTDRDIARRVLIACEALLVPGAIRTLADRSVEFPLPITHNGQLVNDPLHPYWGRYEGDENTHRKPAYHNGTAWTWLFPSFCEAWVNMHGTGARDAALAWLGSSAQIINAGCLGQIPEILDGDYPHRLRGCDAQAWGVTELYRVLKWIETAVPSALSP